MTLTNYKGMMINATVTGISENYLFLEMSNVDLPMVYPIELLSENSARLVSELPKSHSDNLSIKDQKKIFELYKEYYARNGIDPYKKVDPYYLKYSEAPKDPFAP